MSPVALLRKYVADLGRRSDDLHYGECSFFLFCVREGAGMHCEKHLRQKRGLSCSRLSRNPGWRLAQREFLHLVSFPSHAPRATRRYLSHQPGGAPAQESATVEVTKVVLMLHIRLPAWGLTQISKYEGMLRSSTLNWALPNGTLLARRAQPVRPTDCKREEGGCALGGAEAVQSAGCS
jgi:hypothetical protein